MEPDRGETTAVRTFSRVVDCGLGLASAIARVGRPASIRLAPSERARDLCHLHLANVSAGESRRILPASRRSPCVVASHARGRAFGCDDLGGCRIAPGSPLSPGRLALVFDHASAGNRNRGGRTSRARRSLHLFTTDWFVHRADLARC